MTLVVTPGEIVRRAVAGGKPGLLAAAPWWDRIPLGDVASVINGAPFSSRLFNTQGKGMPLVRIRDVVRGSTETYFDGPYEEVHTLGNGDLLVGMDGDFRVAIWNGGRALLNQRVCKLNVTAPQVYDKRFLFFVLQGYLDAIWAETSAVTVKHLSSRTLAQIPLPLPPLDEQRRIVAILEDHLGRLDAAARSITRAESLTQSITKSILLTAIPDDWPGHWQCVTVKEAGDSRLGRQRHPDWHTGPNMKGYLRVANVFEDRIDTSDVMQMDFTDCFDEFKLWPGDVLLNEGQSPHLLGRPAIYRGDPPEVAFTNSLIRFRPRDGITPEWSLLVFRRHMHARRFMRESRITTNIAHLSLKRLLSVEFPVPPLEEQQEIVARIHGQLNAVARLTGEVEKQSSRAVGLRNSLLSSAFSGQLTQESISV